MNLCLEEIHEPEKKNSTLDGIHNNFTEFRQKYAADIVDRVKKTCTIMPYSVVESRGKHHERSLECPGEPPEMF